MRKYVNAPTDAKVSPYGVLSVAALLDAEDEKWSLGVEFETICGDVQIGNAPCTLPITKEAVERDWITAESRPLYSLLTCSLIAGADDADIARANFEAGEQRALEEYFASQYFSHADAIDTGAHTDPVAAVAKMLALWPHGVQPVLHVSIDVATFLAGKGLLDFKDDKVTLETGEPVSIGYGYKDGAGLDDESGLLMLTGPVFGFEGSLKSYQGETVRENTHTILVEKNWLLVPTCSIITGTLTIT